MTSFLRLNGIAISVRDDTAEVSQHDVGDEKTAVDGTPLFNRRATKRIWTLRTAIKTAAEALAIRDLVTGKGHVLNFERNDLYTSKGLPPSYVGDIGLQASTPKYGSYRMYAVAGHRGDWTCFSATGPWTIALWYSTDGTTWNHYVINSSAQKWVNGVRNDAAATAFATVTAGVLSLTAGATNYFDDVAMLPYLVPTDWPPQIHAFGYAFGALPRLTADGLFIENNVAGGISVKGRVGNLKPYQGTIAGTYAGNLQDFDFELLEV